MQHCAALPQNRSSWLRLSFKTTKHTHNESTFLPPHVSFYYIKQRAVKLWTVPGNKGEETEREEEINKTLSR